MYRMGPKKSISNGRASEATAFPDIPGFKYGSELRMLRPDGN